MLEQRGAQLLVAVLLMALAIDGALILTHVLSGSALPPPGSNATGQAPIRAAVNPTVELATIVNAHLFGMAGAQAGGNAPQTTIPLILAGVIAEKDPSKGQAIIGDTATSGKLFAVGAMLPGGARLNGVYGDHVLIERGGRPPAPRPIEALRDDPDVVEALQEGAHLRIVPLILTSGKPVKANLSLDTGVLAAIDAEAKRRGLTRSALVEWLARETLPRLAG